jgi:hypothetical protein
VENARCEASVPCGIIEPDEVESCQMFYDDHCLHGISGDEEPSADQHKSCLDLIEEAGRMAQASLGMGGTGEADEAACGIVAAPWDEPECAYLSTSASSMGGGQ